MIMSRKIFKILPIILVIILLVFVGVRIKELRELPAAANRGGIPVETLEVQPGDISSTVDYTGTVMGRDEVTLAPKITARVDTIAGKEGDRVNKGQLTVTLNDNDLESKVNTLKEKVATAKLNLAYWEKEAESYKYLYEEGALSRQKYDQVILSRDTARASLNEAQAVLNEALTSLNNARIYAPISGVIASIQTFPGDTAVTGKPILTLIDDTEELKVQVNVIERDLLSLKPGNKAMVYLPGDTKPLVNSQISKIYPSLDPVKRTAKVDILIPVSELGDTQLRPGMSVDVFFILKERKKVLLVPKEAVVEDNGNSYLFIVQGDKAIKRKIKAGISDGNQVEVIEGLKAGERVIISNLSEMNDGREIYLFNEGR